MVVRPPHLERLVRTVRTLDAPLIQLWSWPGTGQQAVLDALVAEDPRLAQPISLEDLAEEAMLRRAVEGAVSAGARWLVLPAVPSLPRSAALGAETISRLLPSGRHLVFASPLRLPQGALSVAYVGPEALLLDEDEIATLWLAVCDRVPAPALCRALRRATDGWYRPLLQAAEAAAAGGLPEEGLLALPAVASFLRYEVVAPLPAEERALLPRLALADGVEPALWEPLLSEGEGATLGRLVEDHGLVVAGPERLRLPALLAAYLASAAPAGGASEDLRRLARGLAAGELQRGRAEAALAPLLASADGEALARLVEEGWAELLAAAPLGRLSHALAALAPAAGTATAGDRGAELLAVVVDALLQRRPGTLARLAGLAAGTGDAEVTAVAACLLEVLGQPATAAKAERPAAAQLPSALLPSVLGPLAALTLAAELREDGAEAMAEALLPALVAVPAVAAGEPELLSGPSAEGDRARVSALAALVADAVARLASAVPELPAALRQHPRLTPAWRRRLQAPLTPPPAGEAAVGFDVELLGPGRVLPRPAGGGEELAWPLRRAFKGLAFLASAPGLQATQGELEEVLWPGADEGRIRRNFHPTLSHLRRSLGEALPEGSPPPLERLGGVYRLNPGLVWRVDAQELERLGHEGRERLAEERPEQAAALWERARALYRGPFLGRFDDPWVTARRERLQRVYLGLLRDLGELYSRRDRLAEAVDVLRVALFEDPLQERVHLTLMLLYARQGRRDLVRRQYDRLTELLRRELGVDPTDETAAEYQRLLGRSPHSE